MKTDPDLCIRLSFCKGTFVSDIAVFVLKRDVKLNQPSKGTWNFQIQN